MVIMVERAERWLSGRKRPPAKWVGVEKPLSGSNPDLSASFESPFASPEIIVTCGRRFCLSHQLGQSLGQTRPLFPPSFPLGPLHAARGRPSISENKAFKPKSPDHPCSIHVGENRAPPSPVGHRRRVDVGNERRFENPGGQPTA